MVLTCLSLVVLVMNTNHKWKKCLHSCYHKIYLWAKSQIFNLEFLKIVYNGLHPLSSPYPPSRPSQPYLPLSVPKLRDLVEVQLPLVPRRRAPPHLLLHLSQVLLPRLLLVAGVVLLNPLLWKLPPWLLLLCPLLLWKLPLWMPLLLLLCPPMMVEMVKARDRVVVVVVVVREI
jgi:hypothetical protein